MEPEATHNQHAGVSDPIVNKTMGYVNLHCLQYQRNSPGQVQFTDTNLTCIFIFITLKCKSSVKIPFLLLQVLLGCFHAPLK